MERVLWQEAVFVYTQRYEQVIYERARREPIRQIAQPEPLSEDIVQAIFERWAKKHEATRLSQRDRARFG